MEWRSIGETQKMLLIHKISNLHILLHPSPISCGLSWNSASYQDGKKPQKSMRSCYIVPIDINSQDQNKI